MRDCGCSNDASISQAPHLLAKSAIVWVVFEIRDALVAAARRSCVHHFSRRRAAALLKQVYTWCNGKAGNDPTRYLSDYWALAAAFF